MESPFLKYDRLEDDGSVQLADLSVLDDSYDTGSFGAPRAAAPGAAAEGSRTGTASHASTSDRRDTTDESSRLSSPTPGARRGERERERSGARQTSTTASRSHTASASASRDEREADASQRSRSARQDPAASTTRPADADADAQSDPASPPSREDTLRASLAELRKINGAMDSVLGAIEAAKGHNERLETKVRQSRALLDDYVSLVSQAHHTRQLVLNQHWTGVHDDAAALAAEEERAAAAAAAEEEARRAAEAAREEAARRAEEERERERERAAAAAAATSGRGRGRGWGATGSARGRARGSGIPARASGIPTRTARPGSAAGGRVANYDHVQSSGYGPRR